MSEKAQTKLKQALILLLDDYDFDQLSVSRICKEAGVHRSTFYAYYDNQYSLLEDTQTYLVSLFLAEFKHYQQSFEAEQEYGSFVDSYYLVPYLHYIKAHQKLYRIYLKNPIDFNHRQNAEQYISEHFLERYRERGVTDPKTARYMANFYTAGLRSIIYDWVMADCEDPVDAIVAIIHTIIF